MTTENQEAVKAGAQRMRAVFATKGLNVKQSLMLEALAQGFGVESWRALKAIVDAPRAVTVPTLKAPPIGVMQTWVVDAIYFDNDQQYGSDCYGRTALEAAFDAITERLTDGGLAIGIVEVRNSDGREVLSPSFITEIKLSENESAFVRLLAAYKKFEHLVPAWELSLAKTYGNWLEAALKTYGEDELEYAFDDLTDSAAMSAYSGASLEAHKGFVSASVAVPPSRALTALCEYVEAGFGSLLEMEEQAPETAQTVYQVRALVSHFEDNLDDDRVSPLLELDFECA